MRFGCGFMFANYTDWDRFIALEHGEQAREITKDDGQVYREQLAHADLVEPLGFDTLWAFEQHGAPYLMIPDPTLFLTYFAGRTKKINFGSMITVLPWHNPMRLAEQIAMFSHMIGNRKYYLGVGRGLARRNFEAVGVSMDESRGRFVEVLDVLSLAFSQEVFSYDGEFFKFDNVSLRPRPLDATIIAEAWGSWTSEQSVRLMGSRGLNPLTTPNKTLESYLEDLELLNEVRAENGFGPAQRPILQVPLLCTESAAEAEEKAPQYIREHVDSILTMYELGTSRFGNAKGYEQYTTTGSDFGSGDYNDALETLTTKFLHDGLIGTPEQCIEKLNYHHESVNPSEIVTVCDCGTISSEETQKSMRLFSEKVLSKVDHLRKQPALAG